MKKLAIIGASYLQEPLIRKAKDMGIETHVFAWAAGDIGEKLADYFYPISITEKEQILEKCQEIEIDGICSIASDLAVVTVNYVAEKMNLIGNGIENTALSTNKHNMREAFKRNGDPSPMSIMVDTMDDIDDKIKFPVIVKPLDRSGSRGIFKINDKSKLAVAISGAKKEGFIKRALVEEFVEGVEYSVECLSYKGEHHFLALTYKYTTGSPHFIETGHLEPARISKEMLERIKKVVFHALDTLKVRYGASHSEIKIDTEGNITIIEIGSRMGGDFIGSSLVELSTGVDFVRAVIQIALGDEPDVKANDARYVAAIHFICSNDDIEDYYKIKEEYPEIIVDSDVPQIVDGEVKDSSSRFGYFIMRDTDYSNIDRFMPSQKEE